MSLQEAQARIKARVWQEIAQSDLELSGLDKATLAGLVDLITEAALLEIDDELGRTAEEEEQATPQVSKTAESKKLEEAGVFDDEKEDILWEGRPFLSLRIHYTVTDERVRITEGLLGRSRENIELIRVQDIDYEQTFSERLLNLGDITIRSRDPNKPEVVLNNVKDPEQVYEILRRAVLKAREKHNFAYRQEM